MRLGQLARKLEIRPAEIVEFLSRHNIVIEDGSNTRIEDDHTDLVIRHFNPALRAEVEISENEIQEEVAAAAKITPVQEISVEVKTEEKVILESAPTAIKETQEIIEVIKAPKTELPGLKVLGKIELPEPKKKEPATTEQNESPAELRPPRQERRPVRNNNKRDEAWKNPIAQQREREAKAAEEKRKAQQEFEKEKRMVHYLKKVKKVDQPAKSRKSDYEESVEVGSQKQEVSPKTWLGKFLKWLSTP